MQVINRTRIKGSAILLTLVVSGLFTNCDWCPGPTTKGTDVAVPTDGSQAPVAACGTDVDYYHYTTLNANACVMSVDAAIAQGKEAACLYKVMDNDIQRCPGEGSLTPLSLNDAFTVFWTICNYSDRDSTATDVKSYNLQVYAVDPATMRENPTPYKTFPLTQPLLKPCECVDVGANFNDGGANALPVGTYFFRLDGVYEARNSTVPPVYTRGCASASYHKVTIQ